jgi:indolepyruvate ferredoxin oxidoreductase alpha subunit
MAKITGPAGSCVLLLGNEAIARGALEGGVGVASAYPGTPSTEVVEALFNASGEVELYVEWSVNEKVAFEVAYAAAICGVRSITAMKHVGLNVASDPLMTSAYTGVEDGFLIVSADDPSMWSSQNEQDNRYYGQHAFIPVFEPASPMEAKNMAKAGLEFSSKWKHPVMLRTTTRVSHTRGPVILGELPKPKLKGVFRRNVERWNVIYARKLREEMLKRWSIIAEDVNNVEFNFFEDVDSEDLIIASGLAYSYVKDALKILNRSGEISILKIATTVPVPRKLIVKALSKSSRVLVVEELEPIVEVEVKRIAFEEGFNIEIQGKSLIPQIGELTLENVVNAIARFNGYSYRLPEPLPKPTVNIPLRPPTLCPGCPHRAAFFALKKAVAMSKINPVYCGDIGCYGLGTSPPFETQDTLVEMGGSIGLANGFAHVEDEKTPIAIIGDSTFFHAGIPALINAVYNKAAILVIVLDNKTVAMTGGQPTPETGSYATGGEAPVVMIENIARASGVEYVETVDPYKIQESVEVLSNALKYVKNMGKVALIVMRRKCALNISSIANRRGIKKPIYKVLEDKCKACKVCYNLFSCPAIVEQQNGKALINMLCTGCGVCASICPHNAIVKVGEEDGEWLKLWW